MIKNKTEVGLHENKYKKQKPMLNDPPSHRWFSVKNK